VSFFERLRSSLAPLVIVLIGRLMTGGPAQTFEVGDVVTREQEEVPRLTVLSIEDEGFVWCAWRNPGEAPRKARLLCYLPQKGRLAPRFLVKSLPPMHTPRTEACRFARMKD
jgi:hypothetical protein